MIRAGGPLAGMARETEAFVLAGRTLAWNSGLDLDTMESLIRKIARNARQRLLDTVLMSAANDEDESN